MAAVEVILPKNSMIKILLPRVAVVEAFTFMISTVSMVMIILIPFLSTVAVVEVITFMISVISIISMDSVVSMVILIPFHATVAVVEVRRDCPVWTL